MSNIYGRQVVVPLTNKSGGGVIAGDVVIIDTTNNDAFTTSTSGAFTGLIGIAQETIASNATGRVLTAGYAALVNTSASVTRGNFGKSHTVAKQAVDAGSSRVAGAFCQFLTGGTTPDAHLFGLADNTSGAGTGTLTTVEEVDGSPTDSAVTKLVVPNSSLTIVSHVATLVAMVGTRTEFTLSGDVSIATANTFVDGPTAGVPVAGVYDVRGRLTINMDQAAQNNGVCGRLVANGGTIDEDEVLINLGSANDYAKLYFDARVTADGSNPIKLQATSSYSGHDTLKRDQGNNSASLHRACLLVLTRVS